MSIMPYSSVCLLQQCNFLTKNCGVAMQMMKVEINKFRFGIARCTGKAYVGEDLACEAEMTLILAK